MNRVSLDRVELDPLSMDDVVHRINATIKDGRGPCIHIATVNAQFIQLAAEDPYFAETLRRTNLNVADGVPLVWACRLLKRPLPGRVNGTDLMVRLCEEAATRSYSVYFLGGRPGAAEAAAEQLSRTCKGLRVAGIDCPPMGFTNDRLQEGLTADRVRRAAPDILFVALGAPRQEYWIRDNLDLPVKVMMGVGGSFELVSGMLKRAPLFMQKTGLEWLWRLAMEPGRLWKRYLVGNALFIGIVFRCWWNALLFDNAHTTEKTGAGAD